MTENEKKIAAKEFAEYWKDKGYEKGESQKFWLSLLGEVLGVEHPAQFIQFENQVKLDNTSFIDGTIPSTHVLIEQKSAGKDLRKGIRQSDGTFLTPFQQAKRYSSELPYSVLMTTAPMCFPETRPRRWKPSAPAAARCSWWATA